jgi:hypothetical protein
MPETIEELKKKIEHYERKLGLARFNPAYDGFIVLNNLLKQQNEYLKTITIKELIVTEDKSKSSEYERAKGLWESLPKIISSLNSLKDELGMEFTKEDEHDGETSYSPQTVGKK